MTRNIFKATKKLNAMDNRISVEALELDNHIIFFFFYLSMAAFGFVFAIAGYASGTFSLMVAAGAGAIGIFLIILAVLRERTISKLVN